MKRKPTAIHKNNKYQIHQKWYKKFIKQLENKSTIINLILVIISIIVMVYIGNTAKILSEKSNQLNLLSSPIEYTIVGATFSSNVFIDAENIKNNKPDIYYQDLTAKIYLDYNSGKAKNICISNIDTPTTFYCADSNKNITKEIKNGATIFNNMNYLELGKRYIFSIPKTFDDAEPNTIQETIFNIVIIDEEINITIDFLYATSQQANLSYINGVLDNNDNQIIPADVEYIKDNQIFSIESVTNFNNNLSSEKLKLSEEKILTLRKKIIEYINKYH